MADSVAFEPDKVTEATVTIELSAQSITVNDNGTVDTLYNRTITDKADGTVIVRDVVRVTEHVAVVQPLIDKMKAKAVKETANGE